MEASSCVISRSYLNWELGIEADASIKPSKRDTYHAQDPGEGNKAGMFWKVGMDVGENRRVNEVTMRALYTVVGYLHYISRFTILP
jgi:hypothetical protein